MTKLILGAVTLVALMAGAASAETLTTTRQRAVSNDQAAAQSYAAAPMYGADRAYVTSDPYVVVADGKIVGRDPDPTIRLQLLKDANMPDAE